MDLPPLSFVDVLAVVDLSVMLVSDIFGGGIGVEWVVVKLTRLYIPRYQLNFGGCSPNLLVEGARAEACPSLNADKVYKHFAKLFGARRSILI